MPSHHHHDDARHDHPHHGETHRPASAAAHDHAFLGEDHSRNEKRTWMVVALTTVMMLAEIVAGALFGSMALLADGFHMATHAGALLIAAAAYLYARRHARDARFSFGTGKVGDLAAFASAIVLALVATAIGYESLMRLTSPVPIRFGEAILVAVVGLAVNLVSAVLLHQKEHGDHAHGADGHHADHTDPHAAGAGHGHHDQNLRAAYLHVLADALTSILAIAGLLVGWAYGWVFMDAIVGILGAVVIARWSVGLLKDSGAVLLDVVPSRATEQAIRDAMEVEGDHVSDLHLWRVGPGHMAAVVSIVSAAPRPAETYRDKLTRISGLSHVNVEVLRAS